MSVLLLVGLSEAVRRRLIFVGHFDVNFAGVDVSIDLQAAFGRLDVEEAFFAFAASETANE